MLFGLVMLCVMSAQKKDELITQEKFIYLSNSLNKTIPDVIELRKVIKSLVISFQCGEILDRIS